MANEYRLKLETASEPWEVRCGCVLNPPIETRNMAEIFNDAYGVIDDVMRPVIREKSELCPFCHGTGRETVRVRVRVPVFVTADCDWARGWVMVEGGAICNVTVKIDPMSSKTSECFASEIIKEPLINELVTRWANGEQVEGVAEVTE